MEVDMETSSIATVTAGTFDRALSPYFLGKLAFEAKAEGWWNDILNDSKLVIGLRGKHLNVYWQGQRLFDVSATEAGLNVTTHEKFLLDPSLAGQVPLVKGSFDLSKLLKSGFIGSYEGKPTLAKMKTMASLFAGEEKVGCHEIAVRNSTVIDCEVALPGYVSPMGDPTKKTAPRIDLASLELGPDCKDVRLVFWEAKHFGNGELRSAGEAPPVVEQITKYRNYLAAHGPEILDNYVRVIGNLLEISRMGWARKLDPMVAAVAQGQCKLTLGSQPQVGLIIFGFDQAQRDHVGWQGHLATLQKHGFPVLPRGKAESIRI